MPKNNNAYFTTDFLDFFKELAANNNKDWFDANRKRYEKSVKEPFKDFVSDLIKNVQKEDPEVQIQAKDAIFRINRDIRFSQDKSLYKLDRSAVISPAGRKDHSVPGFYLSLGPERTAFGGGAYSLPTDQLARMREHIIKNPKEFEKLLSDKDFKNHFGELKGEENKRLPKEMQEPAEKQPLLYKKQFYYMTDKDPDLIVSPKLMDTAMEHYRAGRPLQDFFRSALS